MNLFLMDVKARSNGLPGPPPGLELGLPAPVRQGVLCTWLVREPHVETSPGSSQLQGSQHFCADEASCQGSPKRAAEADVVSVTPSLCPELPGAGTTVGSVLKCPSPPAGSYFARICSVNRLLYYGARKIPVSTEFFLEFRDVPLSRGLGDDC